MGTAVDIVTGAPEGRLVRRAQAGDAVAYAELARRHQAVALRVATAVLGTFDGADDVVQQALERAWRSLGTFDRERKFRPWFLRIVANLARNERRSRGRRVSRVRRLATSDRETGTEAVTPEEHVVDESERRMVAEALSCLDPDDRLVIALRYYEGLSERQMSEVMACPPGTVKSRLSRAMGRLRRQLVVWVLVAVLVLAASLVVSPVRRAVADWLGLGSTRVELVPADEADPAGLPSLSDRVLPGSVWSVPVSRAEAEDELGRPLPHIDMPAVALGEPARLLLPPEGGVIMSWEHASTSLWVRRLSHEGAMLFKRVPTDGRFHDVATGERTSRVRYVDGLGAQALLIPGDHVLTTPYRQVAASTVVLWWSPIGREPVDGPDRWEYRLESDLPPAALLEIAHSVRGS